MNSEPPQETGDERRGRDLVRRAAADVRAPLGLRERLETARREAAPRRRRLRLVLLGGLAAVMAGVAVTLALTLPGDVPGGPTVVEAAEFAELPATGPAPAVDPTRRGLLKANVEGVPFPDWYGLEWPASGARTDDLAGRRVTTVFYAREGTEVGYSIIPAPMISPPVATRRQAIGDTTYHSFVAGGRTIVTWMRDGHTCVLSGRGVPRDILVKLAAWEG